MLRRLVLESFRNYEQLEFCPSPCLSLVTGPNGAGKSSLFEAIYILSAGRSFRSGKTRRLLREGAAEATIFAEVEGQGGELHRLGMSRGPEGIRRLRRDGENVRAISELAATLPARILHPGTVGVVEGSARGRRHFMDWGLFHVEQSFAPVWRELRQALEQRNRLLRLGSANPREIGVWSQQVARASARIDQFRKDYVRRLDPVVQELLSRFPEMPRVDISLYPGWSEPGDGQAPEEHLLELLHADLEKDRRQGFTAKGAHRADLRLNGQRGLVRDLFSRGQCKILGYLLFIAQIRVLVESRQADCLVLVDDLASELDENHRDRMIRVLLELEQQTIFSALGPEQLPALREKGAAMFHVEHGVLKHMPEGH